MFDAKVYELELGLWELFYSVHNRSVQNKVALDREFREAHQHVYGYINSGGF